LYTAKESLSKPDESVETMKYTLALCLLVAAVQVPTQAAEKVAIEYQDGVLISSRTESTGSSCSSSGTVNGTVDDNGNVNGTSHSSGGCENIVTHFYTVRVGDETFTLRRTFTGSQRTLAMATLGWGALFMKQSVLAGQRPGTQFKIGIENGTAHVKLGKRESLYRIVGESLTPTNDRMSANPPERDPKNPPLQVAPVPESPKSILDISSTPAGAEIEIDGTFVGNTPSSIEVPPGEHRVSISKKGFDSWQRTIKVMPGHPTIAAELVPAGSTPKN
jgi:hypothetical protein